MDKQTADRIYARFNPDFISEERMETAQDICDELSLWLELNTKESLGILRFPNELVTKLGQIMKKHGAK